MKFHFSPLKLFKKIHLKTAESMLSMISHVISHICGAQFLNINYEYDVRNIELQFFQKLIDITFKNHKLCQIIGAVMTWNVRFLGRLNFIQKLWIINHTIRSIIAHEF